MTALWILLVIFSLYQSGILACIFKRMQRISVRQSSVSGIPIRRPPAPECCKRQPWFLLENNETDAKFLQIDVDAR
jgi:hypothetical protein